MDQAEETCHVFPSPKPLHSRITFFSLRMGAAQWGCFWQEESWQNPLTVIADAPPIGGKFGPHSDGERNSMGWWRSLLWGGVGNEEGPCFRRTTDIIVAKSQWYTIRICNPSGRGIFFGVSELPWFSGAKKSPCLTSRGLCLESFCLCRFGDIYQDVSPGPHWPGVSWMP